MSLFTTPILLFFSLLLLLSAVFIVKQQSAAIIERFGKFEAIYRYDHEHSHKGGGVSGIIVASVWCRVMLVFCAVSPSLFYSVCPDSG